MLELFSGSGNMAEAFRRRGWSTLTVDLHETADWMADVKTIDAREIINRLGGRPDVVWASPPCTAFSVASIGHHWKGGHVASDGAAEGVELLAHTFRLINALKPRYWFIENPRGMMRKLPIMESLPRRTLSFCQYGDSAMKPTDVWTNHQLWYPKMCKPMAPCHERAPRGSMRGTQGKKGAKLRGTLPPALCDEVAGLC